MNGNGRRKYPRAEIKLEKIPGPRARPLRSLYWNVRFILLAIPEIIRQRRRKA